LENTYARLHNLEWAFSKTGAPQGIDLAQQIASLAVAVTKLPRTWPHDNPEEMKGVVQTLLGLSERDSWTTSAWDETQTCHPPIHDLYRASHGLAFLRWLLHRILPYPCFLLDAYYMAAKFRATYSSFASALKQSNGLRTLLEPLQYRGILSDFLGQRWWRSAVESFVWDLTDGNSFDPALVRSRLAARSGVELEPCGPVQPVVCIDQDYRTLPTSFDIESVVRVLLDDWPPYADNAWAPLEVARESAALRALVASQDLGRLNRA
jgi:hypothetical protein